MNAFIRTVAVMVLLWLAGSSAHSVEWRGEQWHAREGWQAAPEMVSPGATEGAIRFARRGVGLAGLTTEVKVDLDATPCIRLLAGPGNAHWRLFAQVGEGRPLLIADHQVGGSCVKNLKTRLGMGGVQTLRLRVTMWGWSGSDPQELILAGPEFVAAIDEQDAVQLSGLMAQRDAECREAVAGLQAQHAEHPRLRYTAAQRDVLREKARTTHRAALGAVWDDVQLAEAGNLPEPQPLTPALLQGDNHVWRAMRLGLRPPQTPADLPEASGWSPFELPGVSLEGSWRVLYWHVVSHWVLGSAITPNPVFAEQGRRWALAISRWRFWQQPHYGYFDFQTSYPLQCLAHCYDIGASLMNEAERQEVVAAIAALSRGLYLNALTGHGSIYNDLRGNHTAVTFCGLGSGGLALLGEHPEAPLWVALAESFMLRAFAEHRSGAWTESPSYGNYGVNEWLRLAEMLRQVSGRDHLQDPFLMRFARFQLMIADWEGRDLGYNGGGPGGRWNHWVFSLIAREFHDPQIQWLAQFGVDNPVGYGDTFWWLDPELEPRRPDATAAGAHYEDVGVSVWRSDWSDQPTILLHHCGRKGQHKEENMNQFTLYVLGQRLLPDGLGGGTAAHNVPLIENRPQNKWMPGEAAGFFTDEIAGYVRGDAGRSYGGRRVVRHLLFLRRGLLLVVDEIDLHAARSETISLNLHPNGEVVARDGGFRLRRGPAALEGVFLQEDGRPLALTVTPREDARRATHDLVARRSGRGPTRTLTVLAFGPDGDLVQPVVAAEPESGSLDLHLGQLCYRIGLQPGVVAETASTDASLWLACLENDRLQEVIACTHDAQPVSLDAPDGRRLGRGTITWRRP